MCFCPRHTCTFVQIWAWGHIRSNSWSFVRSCKFELKVIFPTIAICIKKNLLLSSRWQRMPVRWELHGEGLGQASCELRRNIPHLGLFDLDILKRRPPPKESAPVFRIHPGHSLSNGLHSRAQITQTSQARAKPALICPNVYHLSSYNARIFDMARKARVKMRTENHDE